MYRNIKIQINYEQILEKKINLVNLEFFKIIIN